MKNNVVKAIEFKEISRNELLAGFVQTMMDDGQLSSSSPESLAASPKVVTIPLTCANICRIVALWEGGSAALDRLCSKDKAKARNSIAASINSNPSDSGVEPSIKASTCRRSSSSMRTQRLPDASMNSSIGRIIGQG